MEGITTAVMDQFPSLRTWKHKVILLGGLCFVFYLLGLLLTTEVRTGVVVVERDREAF